MARDPRFRPDPPVVIGVLGGVASGKSTVAREIAAHGLRLVDADRAARRASERPEVRDAIRARFGDGVFAPDGGLDRAALAQVVFGDPAARRDLERITHPPVRAVLEAEIAAALAAGTSVVLDVPLLLEGGLIERCDACVFVEADRATRLARAAARGWDAGELDRREAHQIDLSVKKARCASKIANDRSIQDTRRQVAEVLARLGADRGPTPA